MSSFRIVSSFRKASCNYIPYLHPIPKSHQSFRDQNTEKHPSLTKNQMWYRKIPFPDKYISTWHQPGSRRKKLPISDITSFGIKKHWVSTSQRSLPNLPQWGLLPKARIDWILPTGSNILTSLAFVFVLDHIRWCSGNHVLPEMEPRPPPGKELECSPTTEYNC